MVATPVIVSASETSKDELSQMLYRSRSAFLIVGFFSILINMLMLVSPIYMLQLYDRVLASGSVETLIALTVIALFLLSMLALLEIVRQRVMVRVSMLMSDDLSDRVFYSLFNNHLVRTRATSQPIRDLEAVRQFITTPSLFAFFDAPWVPFFIFLVFWMHVLLGAVAVFGTIVIFCLAIATELVSRRLLKQAGAYSAQSSHFAESSLKNADVLQAMGMLRGLQKKWRKMRDPGVALQASASERLGMLLGISKAFRFSLQVAILGVGGYLALSQIITPGVMIAASIIMGRALAPVELGISGWRGFVAARGAYIRLRRLLLATPKEIEGIELPRPEGRLDVSGVFAGPPGVRAAIVKGVQFSLEPGELCGIIGPSAAGKTTLGRLIVGVWPPQNGSLRLDGAEISQWKPEDRGQYIGYLPQDIELFGGTVADNIARYEENYEPANVLEAAALAGCHELILRLPKGYETEIGEGGNMLSGGQKQRIGLARALYRKPSLIVLDEPNSNLDPEGNNALLAAVLKMKERKTTQIIIAHNLDVLTRADKILVLRNGQPEAFGPAREVLERFLKRKEAIGQN